MKQRVQQNDVRDLFDATDAEARQVLGPEQLPAFMALRHV